MPQREIPIEELHVALRDLILEQVALDEATLRDLIVPEVAHRILAAALVKTNKAKAVHLGAFKLGWKVEISGDGASVVNDVLYAGVIEFGRRPNRPGPPLEPIVEWVRRKLFADQSRRSGMTRSGPRKRGRSGVTKRLMRAAKKLLRRVVRWIKGKLGIKGAKREQVPKPAEQTAEEREAQIMQIAIAIRWKIHHRGTAPRFILRDALKVGPAATAAAVRRYLPTGGARGGA